MKKIIVILFILMPSMLYAQDEFDRGLEELDKVNNLLLDALGSFLKFPEYHDNTLAVFEQLERLNKIYEEWHKTKYEALLKWDNYKTRKFYDSVDKMHAIGEAFEELLRPIVGFAGGGIDGPEMEMLLEPLFESAGWRKKMINVFCDDAYFCEYEYKDFKMMFVKNTRTKSDYSNGKINTIIVEYTHTDGYLGGVIYVAGGVYRMMQYKDSNNPQYKQLLKANSKISK